MAVDFQKIKDKDLYYSYSLAMGRIPYAQSIYKFGKNSQVGAGAFEDIWISGGVL